MHGGIDYCTDATNLFTQLRNTQFCLLHADFCCSLGVEFGGRKQSRSAPFPNIKYHFANMFHSQP